MNQLEAVNYIEANKHHKFYKTSCDYALDIAIHADDEPPGDLITKRRPKESKEIQEYREAIRIAKTEAPVSKVMSSLMKIRKSQDWMIKYPKEVPEKIAKDETLEAYMEEDYPRYTSFTNWFFSVCFKQYIIDANAVSLIMPENVFDKDYKQENNTYTEPYSVIYNSHQVIDYSQEHYLLLSEEKNHYTKERRDYEGKIYYLVDDQFIYEIKEVDPKPVFTITPYEHGIGEMPVVQMGGMVKKEMKNLCLYKSRISPMVPELKEALREYSDLQAEIVQHVHSTLVSHAAQDCSVCGGTGKIISGKDTAPIKCKVCKGKGKYPFNPFENFEVRTPKAGEPAVPNPAAYFLTKQIDIAKLQDQRVQDHIFYSLDSINFGFLAKTPLNQSGYAKDVDKAELNNFVHAVAEDIVRIIDDHYYFINEYRYKVIIPNESEREKLLPTIPVPQKYDILSEQYVLEELTKLKTSKVDTSILNAALVDYANKKFGNDPEIRDFIVSVIELDPFASEDEDTLIMKLQNGGISKLKYTVHCNIKDFIKQAIAEDEEFYSKTFTEKSEIIEGYAQEMIDENSAKGRVINMINAGGATATG